MFNLSGSEVIIILILALVVLGPEKLPDAMRKAGRTWAELRKMSTGFQDEIRKGFDEPVREVRKTADSVRSAATFKQPLPAGKAKAKENRSEDSPAEQPEPAAPDPVDAEAGEPAADPSSDLAT